MSRIANYPVHLPKGVEANFSGQHLSIKGPKGSLTHSIPADVEVTEQDKVLKFVAKTLAADALAGTTRVLVQNIVTGVTTGFERKLLLVGVGYRAQVKGKLLGLTLGFFHPVDYPIPEGITIETPTQTEIVIKSMNKQLLGQVAADIRAYRPP